MIKKEKGAGFRPNPPLSVVGLRVLFRYQDLGLKNETVFQHQFFDAWKSHLFTL